MAMASLGPVVLLFNGIRFGWLRRRSTQFFLADPAASGLGRIQSEAFWITAPNLFPTFFSKWSKEALLRGVPTPTEKHPIADSPIRDGLDLIFGCSEFTGRGLRAGGSDYCNVTNEQYESMLMCRRRQIPSSDARVDFEQETKCARASRPR